MKSFENYSKNETANETNFVEDDPLEGPSWKFNNSIPDCSNENNDESKRNCRFCWTFLLLIIKS